MTQDLIQECCFETKHFEEKYHEQISWKVHPWWCCDNPWWWDERTQKLSLPWLGPVTAPMSVKHQQKVQGCQCSVWSHFKWFKISSSSFSCKFWTASHCGLARAEIKPHWNLSWALSTHNITVTTITLWLFCVCLLLESYWSPLYKIIWDRVENYLITAWSWPESSHC